MYYNQQDVTDIFLWTDVYLFEYVIHSAFKIHSENVIRADCIWNVKYLYAVYIPKESNSDLRVQLAFWEVFPGAKLKFRL